MYVCMYVDVYINKLLNLGLKQYCECMYKYLILRDKIKIKMLLKKSC